MTKAGPHLGPSKAAGEHNDGYRFWALKQGPPIGSLHCHGLDKQLPASCKVQLKGMFCHVVDEELRPHHKAHRRYFLQPVDCVLNSQGS